MSRLQAVDAATAGQLWQIALTQQLAADLKNGKLDLPSFPDVVLRIRKLLADEKSTAAEIAAVVGSEPALAARLLRLANSSALNVSGTPVNDLRSAITRLGANLVRSCSLSFAMKQLQQSEQSRAIAADLKLLWERATLTAAVSRFIAAHTRLVNPDEAMLAGLLHAIGRLYILTHAGRHVDLAEYPDALAQVMLTWHPSIGKAILEGWGLPPAICDAVARQEEIDAGPRGGPPGLADVLAAGLVVADYMEDPDGLSLVVEGSTWFAGLGLDVATCRAVLVDSADEIASLRQALDG